MIMSNVIYVVLWFHLYLFPLLDVGVWHSEDDWDDLGSECLLCVHALRVGTATKERMIIFQAAFPLPVPWAPNVWERFDLPTFMFILTFLKNVATSWEVWLAASRRELKQHFGDQQLSPSDLHPILSRSPQGRGKFLKKTDWGNLFFLCKTLDPAKTCHPPPPPPSPTPHLQIPYALSPG